MLKVTDSEKELSKWIADLREFQLDSYFNMTVLGRAYEYLSKVEILKSDSTIIEAKVGDYSVKLKSSEHEIMGYCSCPHSERCKHLAALIVHQKKIKI